MMSLNKIQIEPVVARLTQTHARSNRLSFQNRIARMIAEESILALTSAADFAFDESSSLSEVDALSRVIAVNDVVINGLHIGVVVLNDDDSVSMPIVLARSNYAKNGSLVVQLSDTVSGSVVGYIDGIRWLNVAEDSKIDAKQDSVSCSFEIDPTFDLTQCLAKLALGGHLQPAAEEVSIKSDVKAADYMHFLREPSSLPVDKQIAIIDNCLASPTVRENMSALCEFNVDGLPDVLRQASAWEVRVTKLAARLQAKYPSWQTLQLIEMLRSTGEKFGGQPESPAFKMQIARALLKGPNSVSGAAELATNVSVRVQGMAETMLEQLFAGRKVVDNVRQYVKNQAAVDIAQQIQSARLDLLNLSQATADEITSALSKLSLQPAYATHSQAESSPVDDINEALQLLTIVKIGDELDHMLSEN